MRLYLFLRFLRKKDTSYVIIISPIQSLSSTLEVWCRVPYDVQHTHNTFRDEDSLLSCKGNRCYCMDRAFLIYSLGVKITPKAL